MINIKGEAVFSNGVLFVIMILLSVSTIVDNLNSSHLRLLIFDNFSNHGGQHESDFTHFDY